MSDNEDLYGHAANEAAQGYEPMPDRQAEAITQAEEAAQPYKAKEFLDDRNTPPTTIERSYFQTEGETAGETSPENQTLEPERAARNLSDARRAELEAEDAVRNWEVANEVDALRGQQPVVESDTVMLVTEHGAPIDRHKFSRRLKSGEDAHAVAAVMLRQWKKPKSGGFNRALRYPKIGY